jgi:hypothetical protein
LLPYSEINTEKIDISNEEFKKNFVASFKNLYFRGFNGILVDIEPVSYGYRDDYLDILDRLNKDLPETAIISAYAVSISREPTNEWQWDPYFYYDVAERVDLISASGYDAFLQKDKYYYHYVRMQVMQLNQINENFLFGIPTHKQYPETPEMTLRAYNSVRGNNFIGVAVFSEWTADEKELAVIKPYLNNTWS